MASLQLHENRALLLREALYALPEEFRRTHVPFRASMRRGQDAEKVYGTVTFVPVTFRQLYGACGIPADDKIVTIDLEIYTENAYLEENLMQPDTEELTPMRVDVKSYVKVGKEGVL